MIFHVTHRHSPENCPSYHREKIEALFKSHSAVEEISRIYNIRLRSYGFNMPKHTAYLMLDATETVSIYSFLRELFPSFPAEVTIEPVVDFQGARDVFEYMSRNKK